MIKSFYIYFCFFTLLAGCFADKKYSYPKGKVSEELYLDQRSNDFLMLKFDRLPSSPILNFQQRLDTVRKRSRNRGVLAPLAFSLIAMATNGIKTIITNEQNKHNTISQFSKTNLYFYDQPSLDGPFDPAGMQFTGFDLVRTIDNGSGNLDTAFIAQFVLDTSKAAEILNNAIFELKLKDFRLKYVKPKVSLTGARKMSVEFDISFLTSYLNDKGSIFDSVVLGKFHLLLKDISIDLKDTTFGACPKDSAERIVSGRSFIVPRSYGYFKTNHGVVSGYNQGLYSIVVNVKECTRPDFGTAVMNENGNFIINTASQEISNKIHN